MFAGGCCGWEASIVGVGRVRMKQLVRDEVWEPWGSSWRARGKIAPLERLYGRQEDNGNGKGADLKTQFFVSSLLGAEGEFHDGDEEQGDAGSDGKLEGNGEGEEQKDFGDGKRGRERVHAETVECEVGIKVWPGNTAFKERATFWVSKCVSDLSLASINDTPGGLKHVLEKGDTRPTVHHFFPKISL